MSPGRGSGSEPGGTEPREGHVRPGSGSRGLAAEQG
jgi:hypothetical protein